MEIITVNKQAYKPSLEDVMDKYYEMFRGKNQGKNFCTAPTTRTEMGELDIGEAGGG